MGIDRRAGRDHQATILTRGTRSDVHISGLTEQQSCSSYTSGDIACLLDISVLVYSATSKAAVQGLTEGDVCKTKTAKRISGRRKNDAEVNGAGRID